MLSLQKLLEARILEKVASFTTIGSPAVFVGLKDIGQLLPACIITPGPSEITVQKVNGATGIEERLWQVSIIIAYQNDDQFHEIAEESAGGYMCQILEIIAGWHPGPGYSKPITYEPSPEPEYKKGYAEFYLHFKSKRSF